MVEAVKERLGRAFALSEAGGALGHIAMPTALARLPNALGKIEAW